MRTGTSTTHSFSYYLALFPLTLIIEDFGIIDTDTGSAQEPARNDPSQVNEINTTSLPLRFISKHAYTHI
ncbi:hypothetical protein PISMIDRAFT_679386 [Pisolithus microcarpus 441]|uniref:Uncharacterized protein n=1 Tax=Pisolithus microcarpus 441 TaxID=765257 RepID=A0A0C9ZUS4_9AGAM|nr:hypothetical protein PISMIDRAFT_679386 [Pisolithus microcarpus 441]